MNSDSTQPSAALPSGTLTFLFTDVEGSARFWEQHADAMREAMARHDVLIERCVAQFSGTIVRPRGEGDSRFAVFQRASDAVLAAADMQRDFLAEPWTTPSPLRVRLGVHTGEADLRDGDYYGNAVNRCARLRSVAHGGQALVSQVTHDLVCSLLPENVSLRDLGKHRLKDLTSPEHFYQLVVAGMPSEFPPLETLAIPSTNLPIQLTAFIGREKEMARVKQMLIASRLLTLTGPGGSGKTRLALQVAAEVTNSFLDGVWLVELAPLSDSLLLAEKVVSVLGLREPSDRPPLNILTSYLHKKKILLILDDCEHLIHAVAQLSQVLLSACPDLTILATSREAMDIPGEYTFRVPPLAVPDPTGVPSVDNLHTVASCEAVQLFLDRALAVQPDFELTRENTAAVADICRRLDGIPLAIELAAARVNTLSVEQIAMRLDDRFRLLTGGSRMALPRHRRLRTCIDWSYELLSEPERIVMRRLSVFPSSWSLLAAEQVCAGDGIERDEILDLYNNLVNKSLVIAQTNRAETRARMLDTIREYAQEKLVESGETERVRSRHVNYFLDVVEQAEVRLKMTEQLEWLKLLELERDNLRAALDWVAQSNDKETGFRLGGALWWFWSIHGNFSEGRELLERLLAKEAEASLPPSPTAARAKVLYGAAHLAWRQGAYERAAVLSAESQTTCEQLGDRVGVAWSLYNQGLNAQSQGAYDQAVALFEQCLCEFRDAHNLWGHAMSLDSLGDVLNSTGDSARAVKVLEEGLHLFRQTGDRWGIAHALSNLGVAESFRGNSLGATTFFQESLALYQEMGDQAGVAYVLDNLGIVASSDGDYVQAATLMEEGLVLRRELGNQRGVAASLGHLGKVAFKRGKPDVATALYKESLNLVTALGERLGIASIFSNLGELAMQQGDLLRAARLSSAADSLRRAIGATLRQAERAEFQQHLKLLRLRMGEADFARGWNEGSTMKLEEAVGYALDGTEETDRQTTAEPSHPSRASAYAPLG